MKVNVQSVNFNADQKLIDFIQRKLDRLENYYDKVIYADVFLKVQNTSAKDNKVTEILLSVPGDDIMVKKTCKKFEECVDECVSSLQRQLIKRKEKLSAHV
ncbi:MULTISPECIES: ribosome hibernation-promoting factor, HPF/YfiA family [Salegentibacter]|uniref:Ribosome-associated translation inhibitor RaiA n=1 Tax=Salegentibacter maritimus TaxID=2794347 RepID=A0ABS0TBS9_9FLAO|nr:MULTISPECIES: ribosome-associated translation inhibitor RaiA [Salegentibacter]MBE7639869.1 ribosome-associated translation inhibitor RaiA [Salegentibacter sp. BLCTC]MBI6116674.1 ribosome-associated translation inhibitor RaiA [Salegentibacter maritimus]MBI6118501.1 ribosome-associated translation inhibitor RaiA [Salegentibacter maritimus]